MLGAMPYDVCINHDQRQRLVASRPESATAVPSVEPATAEGGTPRALTYLLALLSPSMLRVMSVGLEPRQLSPSPTPSRLADPLTHAKIDSLESDSQEA
jgi:hypothetical protein